MTSRAARAPRLASAVNTAGVGYIFTDDVDVVRASSQLLRVGALFLLFDGVQGVFRGVLAGAGKQKVGVRASAIGVLDDATECVQVGVIAGVFGYYGIAIPAALMLAFWAGRGVEGLWEGLSIGPWFGLRFVTHDLCMKST